VIWRDKLREPFELMSGEFDEYHPHHVRCSVENGAHDGGAKHQRFAGGPSRDMQRDLRADFEPRARRQANAGTAYILQYTDLGYGKTLQHKAHRDVHFPAAAEATIPSLILRIS
jgi:hypothetical protein